MKTAKLESTTTEEFFITFLAHLPDFFDDINFEWLAISPPHAFAQLARSIEASPELQQILIEIYRNDPKNSEFCERLVDLDEGFQEWRYRHVKMVQRTIGVKPGTGGSPGAKYLETTLSNPSFPDLWAIRGVL